MDLKIFVNTDDDIRLLRRLKRDVIHRGRTIEGVIKSYNRFVKKAYDEYIKPVIFSLLFVDDASFGHHSAKGRRKRHSNLVYHRKLKKQIEIAGCAGVNATRNQGGHPASISDNR